MKKLRNLKTDNSGAAMITVVIAILFIVALGVALLSVSYLGYAVTLSQETSKGNFYDAGKAMDEIRAGVHAAASDALASAYTETLTGYAANIKKEGYDPQKDFSEKYIATLKATPLMQKNVESKYSAKALRNMVSIPQDCTVTVLGYGGDSESDQSGTVSIQTGTDKNGNAVGTALTLKDVSVKYKNAQNYETTVTSDITIKVPDFNVTASVPHSLKEFSVVADKSLDKTTSSGVSNIAGNVYAGAVNVSAGGNELRFTSGDLLTGGDITVSNSAKLFFGSGDGKDSALDTRELWAKGIKLNGSSSAFATCGGKTYVANDLSVTGAGCSVTLAGEYTGFGGDTAGTKSANKDSSSSILIGGKSTSLHMENLNKLTLAGVSFIDVTGQNDSDAVAMGQSIAVKSDQLAYLAPVGCLGSGYPTNPYAYTGDTAPALTVYTDTPLWPNTKMTNAKGEALNTKTIVDYLGNPTVKGGVTFAKGAISVRYSQSHIAYVFLDFKDQSAANAYFKDYCAANPQNVSQYFRYYLSGDLKPEGKVVSAGNTYGYSDNTLKQNDASVGVSAQGPADLYQNKSASPYSSFVPNEAAIKDTYSFKSGNEIVAVVTNAPNYTYDSSSPNKLQVIVSTGNVTIDRDFNGVVIAKGTVTVNKNIGTQERGAWVPATIDWQTLLNAADGSKKLSDFLGNGSASTGSGANKWDIGDLVVYENWRKS